MADAQDIIFEEVQRFHYLLRLFVAVCECLCFGIILWIITQRPCAMAKVPGWVVVLLPIMFVFPMALVVGAKLETQVRRDGLYVRFFPVHIRFKEFGRYDIEKYYARDYKPIMEYGGWGIRYGAGGKAYNMSGNKSVQLILKNGKKLLIGSQKPEELVKAMDSAFKT